VSLVQPTAGGWHGHPARSAGVTVVIRRRDTVTVRLPPDLAARLRAEADARGVPVPWLLARIVREMLDDLAPGLTLTRPPPVPPNPEREDEPDG
jgi:hypothetical protein